MSVPVARATATRHVGRVQRHHALRLFMTAGAGVASAFALLSALLWRFAAGGDAAYEAMLAFAALGSVFALMAWRASQVNTTAAIVIVVLAVSMAATTVGALMGMGLDWIGLAFVPLLLCAVAPMLPPAATIALAAAHAVLLSMLAVMQVRGFWGGAVDGSIGTWLIAHGALLDTGVTIGLITRRVIDHTAADARAREQRFVGLLAVAADWYWETDSQLRFTHLSEQASGGSGLGADRRLGKAPWEIDNFGLDDDAMDAHRADLEARRAFSDLRIGRRSRDGRQRWLSVSGRPRFDARGVFLGYWGVGRDITAEHEAEHTRWATETRYRELFARSPSPLVLHRDGIVLDANVAALALFGARSPDDLIGCNLLDFYDLDDGSRQLAARRLAWLADLPVGEAAPPQQFGLRTPSGRQLAVQVASPCCRSTATRPSVCAPSRRATARRRC
jgi:PAS domain S-box-containing protein